MKTYGLIIMLIIFLSCNRGGSTKENQEASNNETPATENKITVNSSTFKSLDSFSLSSFKYDRDQKKMIFIDLNDIEKNAWFNTHEYLKFQDKNFDAVKYTSLNCCDNFNTLVIYTIADSYEALLLLILNSKNELINFLEIAGGVCYGPVEDESTGKVKWCSEKQSIVNFPFITVTKTTSISDGFEEDAISVTDSLVSKYKILKNGEIVEFLD